MFSRSTRTAVRAQKLARTYVSEGHPMGSAPEFQSSYADRGPRRSSPSARQSPGSGFPKSDYAGGLNVRRPRWNATHTAKRIMDSRNQGLPPPHLKTLADLSPKQIENILRTALVHKYLSKRVSTGALGRTLAARTIALIFNKRSTRTRVASETAASLLGGKAMFLGNQDIQLGVNETLADTAKVVGSMTDGFMARVDKHEEIEELAKHSPVPVINALCDLYHPTQILADLLTLFEHYTPEPIPDEIGQAYVDRIQLHIYNFLKDEVSILKSLKGKKVAWVGDTNNISNELLVTLPRLGMKFALAAPKGYDKVDPRVWARVEEAGTQDMVTLTNDPAEALKDADVVVTDTWISMGQEEEKATRLQAFSGYQITNEMVERAGAKPDWMFMHCLPRKQEEVDDEVFYGKRSLVFPEAENRKWTIMAVFDAFVGRWSA